MDGLTFLVTNKCSMGQLADGLTSALRWPVHDKTGVAGDHAFVVHYLPTGAAGPAGPVDTSITVTAIVDDAPPIFAAVQRQLGLKLGTEQAPVQLLVNLTVSPPLAFGHAS